MVLAKIYISFIFNTHARVINNWPLFENIILSPIVVDVIFLSATTRIQKE